MDEGNQSVVSEFVLLELSHSQNFQVLLIIILSTIYLIIVPGNIVIITLIISDPRLHTPMYFLLANLSFIDMWLSSNTTPKMIIDIFREKKTISFRGCMSQIFFSQFIAALEMVLLVAMAYDRYVAICKPLHYFTIMNLQRCIGLVVTAWTIGIVHAVSQLILIVPLPFCGPREIDSFFCDRPLVVKLACTDLSNLELFMNVNCGVVAVIPFILLLISYAHILLTVSKGSKIGASKALSTCTAHIIVVVLFFGPCIFLYVWPLSITWMDKFLAVFYSIFTPLLNPAIYTLRNKEIKNAVERLTGYYMHSKGKT
ncbi:olfactory receptor 4K3-like [Castor canadensis]|uniref:olfactory receptor 4K3-like n=1 Tax=Castor canadensis TaxID=51338 RepID=UPI003D186C6F